MDPNELFKGEVEETVDKVHLAMENLKVFKNVYEMYRSKVKSYSDDGSLHEWDFEPQIVFHRFNQYVERIACIMVSLS